MSPLEQAKASYEKAAALPYPVDLEIGSWWRSRLEQARARITSFKTQEEAVGYAQGAESGFEHRLFDVEAATRAARAKIAALEAIFPQWRWKDSPFEEAANSIAGFNLDGRRASSMFFTHVGYFLRCGEAGAHSILEIGGGYGALARLFKLGTPRAAYTIVDLPESLFCAHVFLAANFPSAKIGWLGEGEGFDFLLVPAQKAGDLAGRSYDLVVNTGSFQEMPDAAVAHWMRLVQSAIKTRFLYSFNYFLVNKRTERETSGVQANLICPVLDARWSVRHLEINPGALTLDADGRNWLEVLVERVATPANGQALLAQAKKHPRASAEWFKHVWPAVWADGPTAAGEMVAGLELFRWVGRAATPPNYLTPKASARALLRRLVEGTALRSFLRPSLNDFSELDYYRARARSGT